MTTLRFFSSYIVAAVLVLIVIFGIIDQISKLDDENPVIEDLSTREPMDIQYLAISKVMSH